MFLFGKKKEKQPKMKIDPDSINVIREINGKGFAIVYEIEPDGTERIIGKGGGCANFTADDFVTIICNGSEIFRCTVESLRASLLMSGNGVRLEGLTENGDFHKIIAIFNKMG